MEVGSHDGIGRGGRSAMACGDDDESDEVSVCDQKVEVEDSVRALTNPDLLTSVRMRSMRRSRMFAPISAV